MPDERKRLGAWYTPPELAEIVVDGALAEFRPPSGRPVRVLDPACGDGRLLVAVADRLAAVGVSVDAVGCDVDAGALERVRDPRIRRLHADALTHDWADARFDVVVGNPPFLSQMATTTTRGGASRHGGGPYADAAAEFLALAVRLADPSGGRVSLVLPQSVLGSRDAAPVRRTVDADVVWSWWEPAQRHFDASVDVCVVALRRPSTGDTRPWTAIVTDRLGVPPLDLGHLRTNGTLIDRADLNANFRDEYYALVPAVSDDAEGPPLVTSGLIDPGVCHWGRKPVRFAKQDFLAPRVDLDRLSGRFVDWARRKLVPKVLVANQTRTVEAVADPDGVWLPGVPVTSVTPSRPDDVHAIAAALTSPVATAAAWHHGAGTGLSATTIRLGPASLGATPWPAGDLTPAVRALRAGDVVDCGAAVCDAYGLGGSERDELVSWWATLLPRDRA